MADSPETNTDGPLGVSIKLAGEALADDLQISSIRVTNAVNRIPEATFAIVIEGAQFGDYDTIDSDDFALGTEVEIAGFYGDGDEQALFKGIIVTTRVRLDSGGRMMLELMCRDKAIALTEVRSSASYLDMSDSDMMSAIIADAAAGLTSDIEATTDARSATLRAGSTDWDYLRLLADRNGYVLTLDDAKITAKAPDTTAAPVLTATFGIDVMELDISVDAHRMISSAKAQAWSEKDQTLVDGAADSIPALTVGNLTAAKVAEVLNDRVQMASTAREFTAADLNTFTEARLARASLAIVQGSVKFQGCGTIHPSDMLEIAGLGNRFGGNGYVSSVDHSINAGTWSTQVRLGVPQDWTTDSHGLAGPAAEALTVPIHGMQIGKVMTVAEDPDGKQRIQVSLPMISDPPAEVWARYATPYASSGIGFQFLPEVDDEVVVAFLSADPNAPVIVGSLHNDKAKRPLVEEADNNFKTIVTREQLKVSFDDDQKIITVETPGGHILTMDDAATSFSMEDMNGNSIVMDAAGITLKSDADITVEAGGNVNIEATADATVKGLNVTCDAGTAFTGKGGATAEVSSGGQTTVKAPMVMIN